MVERIDFSDFAKRRFTTAPPPKLENLSGDRCFTNDRQQAAAICCPFHPMTDHVFGYIEIAFARNRIKP